MRVTHGFLLILVLLVSLSFNISAQELLGEEKEPGGLIWSGYFENQAFLLKSRSLDGIYLSDYNKLRLDMECEVSKSTTFNADIILLSTHGLTEYDLADFMPLSIAETISPEIAPLLKLKFENDIYINDAYVTFYLEGLTVRIGKQQLPWGTGYTWNPTDNLHPKNQLDPTYEKRGVNALKIEVPLGLDGNITAIASTKELSDQPSYAFKIKKNIAGFDLSVSYQYLQETKTDFTSFADMEAQRQIIGADFTGQLFGLGFWGEGIYNIDENGYMDDYYEFLLGADYTFHGGLYIMAEYYHRDQGIMQKEDYTLPDFLRVAFGEFTNIGPDYLAAGLSYPLTDLINLRTYSIINLTDGSWILIPWLIFSAGDDIEVSLALNAFFGENGTEYGEFSSGGLARVRIYF